ncbi:MAG: alpha/beta hydrolase [Elusimicrobia bacterium]|nr:alpha/beta hydrolase [Elusimicrobiota bacterium]
MTLVLFPGLGADSRLLRPLGIPGLRIAENLAPEEGESLTHFAERSIEAHGRKDGDFIGGASFGGMAAAEMSLQMKAAGLVLLGSCVAPPRLPAFMHLLYRFRALVPDFALSLRGFPALVRWRFRPVGDAELGLLCDMASRTLAAHIREYGRMAYEWQGLGRPDCPVLRVHGDSDRVIPLREGEEAVVLRNAGHAFTLTYPAETSEAVSAFMRGGAGRSRNSPQ